MKIIKNGKILDAQGNLISKDLLIENGIITEISEKIDKKHAKIIDAN